MQVLFNLFNVEVIRLGGSVVKKTWASVSNCSNHGNREGVVISLTEN